VLGPTATGKSALALAIAERFGGEIVNCDSTAVYRGFDIGTDKIAAADRRGIPHHLIDIVEPTEEYTAAQFARDAAAAIRGIHARGRLPILAGGTGFYFRALTRGLFPGPGADPALRRRLDSIAMRRGVAFLHRMLRRFDAAFARSRSSSSRAVRSPRTSRRPRPRSPISTSSRRRCGCRRRRLPRASRAASTTSSRAACSTRSAACSPAACRRPRGRSAASCTGRRSSTFTACATKRRRARSSRRRIGATRGGS